MNIHPKQPINNTNSDIEPNFEEIYGRSPLGEWIYFEHDLPQLPLPRNVVVEREFIEIDGWLFPYPCVCEIWLEWFQKTMLRWIESDDSEKNKKLVENIAQAFQDAISGKL